MTRRVEVVDVTGSLSSPRALAELAVAVLSTEGSTGVFSLALVGEGVMTDLNRRYRAEDGPTDVLSFPERGAFAAEAWPEILAHDRESSAPPTEPSLGEVIVCPTVVRRYAAEEGVTPGRQLAWTVIHGTLHLLGYDHEQDHGEMRAREHVLLEQLADMLRDLDLCGPGPGDES